MILKSSSEEGEPEPVVPMGDNDDAVMDVDAPEMDVPVDEEEQEEPETDVPQSNSAVTVQTVTDLLAIGARTGRGEFSTDDDKSAAANLIAILENSYSIQEPAASPVLQGTWDLVYSDTQLFRSSPFFMAGRAVCSTKEQADQYDWFCDMHRAALAISVIGSVRQIVSDTRLVSEFEVKAGSVPFLRDFTPFAYSGGWPVTVDGAIVSSADITPTSDNSGWEIFMDTVEIKGSNIPGVRQVLDGGLKLQSRPLADALSNTIESYESPRPVFKTTYLSETLRISRDQDGKVFVYSKASDSTTPTDYSAVSSDLGVLKLLEGFNDKVAKQFL